MAAARDDGTQRDEAGAGARTHERAMHEIDALEAGFDALFDAIDRARASARAELGLSPVECRIIRALCRSEQSIGALARHVGARRSSVSMAVLRLEDRGLVSRRSEGARSVISVENALRHQYEETCRVPLRMAIADWVLDADPTAPVATDSPAAQTRAMLLHATRCIEEARQVHAARGISGRLHDALLRGDGEQAFAAARELLVDGDPRAAYEAVAAAMHRIGASWERRAIDLADERIASGAARAVVERLHVLTTHGSVSERAPAVLVTVPAQEEHVLGARIVTCELERRGWRAPMLTGLVDEDVARVRSRVGACATVVVVTNAQHLEDAERLVHQLLPGGPVVVGGQALGNAHARERFTALGATPCTSLAELVPTIEALVPERRPAQRRAA